MAARHLASVNTLQYLSPGPATLNTLHLVAMKVIPCISVDSSSSIMTSSGKVYIHVHNFDVFKFRVCNLTGLCLSHLCTNF